MSPRFRVRMGMLGMAFIASLLGGAARAQQLDDALRSPGLAPDPIERSPRLLGMGRLSLVIDARNNRINLWDFAGVPTGIAESETTSTFELRPSTAAASDKRDVIAGGRGRERQNLAAREMELGYETWRRTEDGSAYGAIGGLTRLRRDRPYGDALELRSEHLVPRIMPVLTGRMPFLFTDRMRYAFRVQYQYASTVDTYRQIVRNGAGDYIDQDGTEVSPPDFFTPNEYTQTGTGIGFSTSYKFGDPLTSAIGIDYVSNDLESLNDGDRHRAEITEERPYTTLQGALTGRFGSLEYGLDGKSWRSASEQRWAFTTSSGVGAVPLTSRGKLLERRERGSDVRSRGRLVVGNLEFGLRTSNAYRRAEVLAPNPADTTSFNFFRNRLLDRVSADSLFVPDSVSSDVATFHGWDVAGGVSWRFADRRGVVGFEFETHADRTERTIAGAGPEPKGWEARAGAEWWWVPNLAVRGGYIHGWDDRDDLTKNNEFVTEGITVGLGLHPAGSIWTLDLGYLVEWSAADFGDPGLPRGSRQNLAMQFAWAF